MSSSDIERQRVFREKMYAAGFKQTAIWINRKEVRYVKNMQHGVFMKRLGKITLGWNEKDLSELYNLIIKIASAKKEVIRLRKKE